MSKKNRKKTPKPAVQTATPAGRGETGGRDELLDKKKAAVLGTGERKFPKGWILGAIMLVMAGSALAALVMGGEETPPPLPVAQSVTARPAPALPAPEIAPPPDPAPVTAGEAPVQEESASVQVASALAQVASASAQVAQAPAQVAQAPAQVAQAPPQAASAPAQVAVVTHPASLFDDGSARFFQYEANGQTIRYFILKSSDNVIRAAFDACDVCWPAGKGYQQDDEYMICRNCNRRFECIRVNEVQGGCNPAPLARRVENGQVVLEVSDILKGGQYFNFDGKA